MNNKEHPQLDLGEFTGDEAEEEWVDMPEYVRGSRGAIKRVVINFESEDDMRLFNEATGLNVTMQTRFGTFFPERPSRKLEYVDE